MRECTDKRFWETLHAYELGQLQGDELAAFERHLMSCEACFREIEWFGRVSQRLVRSKDVRSNVRQAVKAGAERRAPRRGVRRRVWLWIPVGVAAMIALLLRPWTIEISPTREAVAAENLLLVTCFDTEADAQNPGWTPEILATLLVADLSESRFVQAVSRERMFDLLKARGVTGACPSDRDMAYDIARDVGARWLLSGIIVGSPPGLVLQSRLIEVSTGNIIASQTVSAGSADDVFAIVDRLAAEIRTELLLPADMATETDRAVSEITTSSPEAYATYVEGTDQLLRHNPQAAVRAFREAIRYDSTFAMAYYHLAGLDDPELIYRALEHSDHATQKEQLFIESRAAAIQGNVELAIEKAETIVERYHDEKVAYAMLGDYYFGAGRYERAVAHYQLAVAIDSAYTRALNQLAYAQARRGDLQAALNVLDTYAAAAPDDPNPYDSRGEILALYGRLDEAIEALESALQRRPDFCPSRVRLGALYMYRGEFDRADRTFLAVIQDTLCAEAYFAGLLRACMYAGTGRFDSTLKMLDGLLADTQLPADVRSLAITCKALILSEMGDAPAALTAVESTLRAGQEYYPDLLAGFQSYYVMLVAECGDTAAVESLVDHLRTFSERGRMQWGCYVAARGYQEFSQGRYAPAARYFGQITDELTGPWQANYFERNWIRALALLKTGEYRQAILIFERLQGDYAYPRALWPVWDVKTHYFLGQAYELAGEREQAISHYSHFLLAWGHAEPELPSVNDARERYARLKNPF